ncbi:MAG: enoyl-CoA hydratase [Sphingobacteriales bacterium]|jgi:enoyl-CoA hydratase
MSFDNILVEKTGGVATIFINREPKLNALNKATIKELNSAFTDAFADKEVRAIILSGAGNKAFVAGADISEFAHFSSADGQKLAKEGHELLFDFIENGPKPVIAAVNGFALGGGLELAMSCHMRVASDNAKLGLPEVSLGVIPGYGGTQRLPQLIGKGRAMEMILTAGMIDAAKACEFGLVNHVTTPEELLTFCEDIAKKIMRHSPVAHKAAISAINAGFDSSKDGYKEEQKAFGDCFGTPDFIEGTTAFLEKRKPVFKGE